MSRRAAYGGVLVEPLSRLVLSVVGAGVVTQLLVGLVLAGRGPVTTLQVEGGTPAWAHGPVLLAGLLVLTVLGDLVMVRVRHGEQAEELTLYEAAVVVVVLLLPVGPPCSSRSRPASCARSYAAAAC